MKNFYSGVILNVVKDLGNIHVAVHEIFRTESSTTRLRCTPLRSE